MKISVTREVEMRKVRNPRQTGRGHEVTFRSTHGGHHWPYEVISNGESHGVVIKSQAGSWAGKRHDNTQGPWMDTRLQAANWLIYGDSRERNPMRNMNPRQTKSDLLRQINADPFLSQYFETALWSTDDNADESGGEPLDSNYGIEDFEFKSLQKMVNDAEAFLNTPGVRDAIESTLFDYEQAAHDLWLTRNGHGAGFWDGDWPEPEAALLTNVAERLGQRDIYVGDTGKLYV